MVVTLFQQSPWWCCRYKDLNARLNRLLVEERKNLHQVRQNYALEMRTRTEMEMILRQCVNDIRQEIGRV